MIDDSFEVASDVVHRKSDRLYAVSMRPQVSALISRGNLLEVMRSAVDFDRERCRCTKEIENVRAARMLPAELQAAGL